MIERIFHQIWLSRDDSDLPKEFHRFRDSWLEAHPNWDYRLWTLGNIDFEPQCAALLPQCRHYAQMADLLRMEIIFRYGGVYIDVDFECLRPIDPLLEGVRAFSCSEDGRNLSIGILGAEPGSSVFSSVIESFPPTITTEPINVTTGPVFFTKAVLTSGVHNNFTIYPSHYFYPFNYWTKSDGNHDMSEAYAIHHYAGTWKATESKASRVVTTLRKKLSKLLALSRRD